jgi:hypothetical protein
MVQFDREPHLTAVRFLASNLVRNQSPLVRSRHQSYPRECIGDDKNGRLRVLRGKECNLKCLAVAAKGAPRDSAAIVDEMDKLPRQINGKCTAEDGLPGGAGHGTACFPLKTIRAVAAWVESHGVVLAGRI